MYLCVVYSGGSSGIMYCSGRYAVGNGDADSRRGEGTEDVTVLRVRFDV